MVAKKTVKKSATLPGGTTRRGGKCAKKDLAPKAKDPSQPLWLQVQEAEDKKTPTKMTETARTMEQNVLKAMRVSLRMPGVTVEQARTLVNSEGEELFSRMMSDREKSERGDPTAPTYGKKYYDDLRTEFAPSNAPHKRLRVNDDGQ